MRFPRLYVITFNPPVFFFIQILVLLLILLQVYNVIPLGLFSDGDEFSLVIHLHKVSSVEVEVVGGC